MCALIKYCAQHESKVDGEYLRRVCVCTHAELHRIYVSARIARPTRTWREGNKSVSENLADNEIDILHEINAISFGKNIAKGRFSVVPNNQRISER